MFKVVLEHTCCCRQRQLCNRNVTEARQTYGVSEELTLQRLLTQWFSTGGSFPPTPGDSWQHLETLGLSQMEEGCSVNAYRLTLLIKNDLALGATAE